MLLCICLIIYLDVTTKNTNRVIQKRAQTQPSRVTGKRKEEQTMTRNNNTVAITDIMSNLNSSNTDNSFTWLIRTRF